MENHSKAKAIIFVIIAGTLWGSIGLFVRGYTQYNLVAMDIVGIRTASTALLTFIWIILYNPKLLRIKWKDLWCFLGTGIGSIIFFNYCYFKCITLTSMSVAAVLLYTAPAIVMIISFFLFKEKLTVRKVTALLMTLVGCIFVTGIVGSNQPLSVQGILVGLGAGLGYALYSIFSRFALQRGYDSLTIMFYTFFIAAMVSFPMSNTSEIISIWTTYPKIFLFSILFGAISTVLPYGLYTRALEDLENGKASIIATIEPVVASLLGVLIYKETLTLYETIGMFCIIGAIILCNLKTVSKSTLECKDNY